MASTDKTIAAQRFAAARSVPDNELPGMWERADFEGGEDEVRGPDWRPHGMAWVDVLRREIVERRPSWSAMPDNIYTRYLWVGEWMSNLSDNDMRTFCLLVIEAES
jgi:hypothetical protein